MPAVTDSQVASCVQARVLPVEDWERLRTFGPFQQAGGVLPDPSHAFVVILEDGGELVGTWMAKNTVMLEGLFISPAYRKSFTPSKALLLGMLKELRAAGVGEAITLIQSMYVEGLAVAAGFQRLDGSVHIVKIGRET